MRSTLLRSVVILSVLALGAAAVPDSALAAPPTPSRGKGPAVSADHRPLTRVAELPDTPAAQRAEARGKAISFSEVTAGTDAAVAGITWPDASAPSEARYRLVTDGVVADWADLGTEGVPTNGRVGTEPVILAPGETLQVAVLSDQPVEPTLSLYSATSESLTAQRTAQAATSTAAHDQLRPAIRSRADWGADENIVGLPYTEGIVSGAMIHHTAGTNNYTAADVPGLLRGIQAYHVNTRGWKDIAYNVLVDKFGTAWEGRGGGLDRAIEGGHGFGVTNARVFGLSLMGNYQLVKPTAAMIETAQQVIAWKFALHGVDPDGSTFGSGGQDGGSTHLPAISGHRDENATDCPGQYVYALMPQIRAAVRAKLDGVSYTVTQPQPNPIPVLTSPDPIDGKYRLPETGILDKGTVIEMQKWLSVTADGVWGSGTTRALQSRIGAPVTGLRDTRTILQLQAVVGSPGTGTLDSATILGLQRMLNTLPAPHTPIPGTVVYAAHVSGVGWMRGVADGGTAGTAGRNTVEALRVQLDPAHAGGVTWRGYVSGIGWMPPTDTSNYVGTVGQGKPLEAFELSLTGDVASSYSVEYRAHVQGVGWQAWVRDGATAGTPGRSRAIEAVEIVLKPAAKTPATTPTSYSAHSADVGWGPTVGDDTTAGTIGKRLEALTVEVAVPDVIGGLSYRAHVQDIGWMAPQPSGSPIGTTGRSLAVEAFQMSLTGDLATRYSVRYRAYVQGIGWQDWVTDGATAGTTGQTRQIEAVQVTLDPKPA